LLLKIAAYCLFGFSGIFLLIVLCSFNSIRLSIAVVRASATFVSNNLHSIIVPFLSLIFSVAFFALWGLAAIYLFSVGEIEGTTGGYQYRHVKWDD